MVARAMARSRGAGGGAEPDKLAAEIAEDLQTALELFSTIARAVKE
jgi:hypothetical protein